MKARRILALAAVGAMLVVAVGASLGATGPYNTTDPTVFAPKCLNPLHRSYKHCLDASSVGGVTLTGNTHTIDPATGGQVKLSLDTPPMCPAVLKKGQAPCTTMINWGVLYGASLAKWGLETTDTVEAQRVVGCNGNDRTCAFTPAYAGPSGPPLPDGTALRVTAVAEVVGLRCGPTAAHGYCNHWEDWLLRLHSTSPKLGVDWTMPARLTDARAESWSQSSYGIGSLDYVDPPGWPVNLFTTDGDSPICPSGVTFKWTVSGEGETQTLPGDGCKVTATVKKLGTYSVTAEELKGGVPDGTKAVNDNVVVRDWLIVGLGDSNGSGQGNAPYLDDQCDRSVVSYQYQVARYIEDRDPRSSVTFLWASCSGARSDQLWRNTYEGQEASKGSTLPPQLEQITGRVVASHRKIDAVVMSVGINDLYFGAIMGFCTTYDTVVHPTLSGKTCESAHVEKGLDSQGYVSDYSQSSDAGAPTLKAETADRLKELPTDFRLLAAQLNKLDPAHIFATQYPDETTDAGGNLCNGTGPAPRLADTVWGWLKDVGDELNSDVAHTSSLGWTPVTGIPQDFVGHGYCSPDSYFRTVASSGFQTITGSLLLQWSAYGSFHANPAGQAITFAHTRDAVCQALYRNPSCDGTPPAPK